LDNDKAHPLVQVDHMKPPQGTYFGPDSGDKLKRLVEDSYAVEIFWFPLTSYVTSVHNYDPMKDRNWMKVFTKRLAVSFCLFLRAYPLLWSFYVDWNERSPSGQKSQSFQPARPFKALRKAPRQDARGGYWSVYGLASSSVICALNKTHRKKDECKLSDR
jgi:hypothetical protein